MATATLLSSGILETEPEASWAARVISSLQAWTARSRSTESAESALDLNDPAWIARVQAGDEDAARALIHRLYPTVIKSIRCRLPRRTSEEDLVQTVFVKIFNKLDQFSGRVPLEHWVSRIAINTCLNQLQHETVRKELRMSDLSEDEEAVIEHLNSSEQELPGDQSSAARELLEKLMERLKPEERLVITLLHIEERSVKEISRRTGWSVPMVKVRAFRARHRMRHLCKTVLKGKLA